MRKSMKLIEITARCGDYQKILHITSLPCGWRVLQNRVQAARPLSHMSLNGLPHAILSCGQNDVHTNTRPKPKKMLQQEDFAKIPPPWLGPSRQPAVGNNRNTSMFVRKDGKVHT